MVSIFEGNKMSDLHNVSYDQLYHQELIELEITEVICRYMKDHNISRDDLVELLKPINGVISSLSIGVEKEFIDGFLNEGKNNTIPVLAEFCYALGADIKVELVDK